MKEYKNWIFKKQRSGSCCTLG